MSYRIATHKIDKSGDRRFERPEEIFVVFTDLPHHQGRFYGLRSGFGHCFMLYRFGEDWWVVDPLFAGITHARIQGLSRQGMIDLLLSQGCRIVVLPPDSMAGAGSQSRARGALGAWEVQFGMVSFGIFSCVTLVKRCLGLRRPWLITPFGLYKFFIRTNKENY